MVYRDSRRSAFWIPTRLGKILAKTPEWKATLNDYHLTITVGNRVTCCHVSEVIDINVRCGFFWAVVVFTFGTNQQISIDWIRNAVARDLRNCILYNKVFFKRSEELQKQKELDERKRREDATRKKKKEQRDLAKFKSALTSILEWVSAVKAKLKACREKPRWFTSEEEEYLLKTKPNSTYISLLKKPVVKYFLEAAEPDVIDAIDFWQGDLRAIVSKHNADFSESEPSDCKGYLDQVEKSPLTDEQSRAVICFDNRVLLVASAGSGKTSTMVARAGYALHRKLVKPDRILLLAFNKDAAIELQTRITQQLEPLGFPVSKFVARTFHAFGLQIIGKATGKKPHLAPWLDQGKDLEKLAEIVDHLKDNDPSYRAKWDIFRLVFSRDLSKFGSQDEPEDWDGRTSASGFRTLGGEIVKSREERLIADWLFYNGIEYLYEHPYEYQTADVDHGQYHPDFYYPGANAYHEHFALDANGIPPSNFDGYMEGVQWKRELHATRETTLWETTSATIRDGTAFDILSQHLTAAGVTLDPNPDRPVQGRWVVENSELFKLFRTFLTHVKSNEFTNETLLSQIDSQNTDAFRYRHQIFLQLFTPIREEWDRRLRSEGAVDFEDMLNRAAHLLEKEKWKSPFELVMVDEFQDASRARARLVRALVASPGRFLFAVGDDWQSINRFAGADISVMTDFETWFGKSQTLRLERTFRCNQPLCDISSQFVMKNPSQITKHVISEQISYQPVIEAFLVSDESRITGAIHTYLSKLHNGLEEGSIPPSNGNKVRVFILGRYRKDQELIPYTWQKDFSDRIHLSFSTIHGSKGLEADYVILPRLKTGIYGFPCDIEDDPLLALAMPQGEHFPQAEERRLFYVAMTRAKRSVTMITVQHRMSSFLTELVKEHRIIVKDIEGEIIETVTCPECAKGVMVPRINGKNGTQFWGCNRFPKCRYTTNALDSMTMEHRVNYTRNRINQN